MKDYSIRVVVEGASRTFHVEAYDWADAQGQIDSAYKGHQGYEGVVEVTQLSTLPGADAPPHTPQEQPGVYSETDKLYWSYIRSDILCYSSINPSALAEAFKTAQDEGCYTTSQLEALSVILQDAITHTAAIQGLTA